MRNILLFLILTLIPSFVVAETITLKSGKVIEGTITKRVEDEIKVDTGSGIAVTYYLDEIDSINGESLQQEEPFVPVREPVVVERTQPIVVDYKSGYVAPQRVNQNDTLEEKPSIAEEIRPEAVSIETNQAMKEYVNDDFGIKFSYPDNWQVFDRNIYPDIFFSGKTEEEMANVLCVFSPAKEWDNLTPNLMLIGEILMEELRELSPRALAEQQVAVLNEDIANLSPQDRALFLSIPKIIEIGNKNVVYFLNKLSGAENDFVAAQYLLFNGAGIYTFALGTTYDKYNLYEPVVKDIISSAEFSEIEFTSQGASKQVSAKSLRHRSQSLAGLIWALLAILGGVYVLKNPKANNLFAIICFLYAAWQLYYFLF